MSWPALRWAFAQRDLPLTALAVLRELAWRADQANRATVAAATLAGRLGCSERTVRRAVQALKERTLLAVEPRGGGDGGGRRPATYRLALPGASGQADTVSGSPINGGGYRTNRPGLPDKQADTVSGSPQEGMWTHCPPIKNKLKVKRISPPLAVVHRTTDGGEAAAARGGESLSLPEDALAEAMLEVNGGRAPTIPEAVTRFLYEYHQFREGGVDGPELLRRRRALRRMHPGWSSLGTTTLLRHGHLAAQGRPPEPAPDPEPPAGVTERAGAGAEAERREAKRRTAAAKEAARAMLPERLRGRWLGEAPGWGSAARLEGGEP